MMQMDSKEYLEAKRRNMEIVVRIGFWSAVLTAILAALFIFLGLFGSTYTEPNPYPYVSTFIKNIDYVLFYPGFLLAPVFMVLLACIHYYTHPARKIFSFIALLFGLIYAAIIIPDYFLLWTVVLPSILSGQTANLSLISLYNPHGIFIALESLAYIMMSAAFLFLAPVFKGGKIEKGLKWLFIAGFILAMGSFAFISLMGYDIVIFEVAIITINIAVLIVSGVLISILFRKAGKLRVKGFWKNEIHYNFIFIPPP